MKPTPELVDALYRDKVLQARAMTSQERFLSGYELFEQGVSLMRDGIRLQHPDADEEEIERRVRHRLAIADAIVSAAVPVNEVPV